MLYEGPAALREAVAVGMESRHATRSASSRSSAKLEIPTVSKSSSSREYEDLGRLSSGHSDL